MLQLLDLTGRAAREEVESRTPLFIEFLLRQNEDTKHVLGALLWASSDTVQSNPEADQEDGFSDLQWAERLSWHTNAEGFTLSLMFTQQNIEDETLW